MSLLATKLSLVILIIDEWHRGVRKHETKVIFLMLTSQVISRYYTVPANYYMFSKMR